MVYLAVITPSRWCLTAAILLWRCSASYDRPKTDLLWPLLIQPETDGVLFAAHLTRYLRLRGCGWIIIAVCAVFLRLGWQVNQTRFCLTRWRAQNWYESVVDIEYIVSLLVVFITLTAINLVSQYLNLRWHLYTDNPKLTAGPVPSAVRASRRCGVV